MNSLENQNGSGDISDQKEDIGNISQNIQEMYEKVIYNLIQENTEEQPFKYKYNARDILK